MRRFFFEVLLIFALFHSPTARPANPQTLDYLYIEANVGNASGGHVAAKLGDVVYHFQNNDGYVRLTREDWDHFRFFYNDVDNRNIHVASIPLHAGSGEKISNRLSLLLMIENRHADYLKALQTDAELLRENQQSSQWLQNSQLLFFAPSRTPPLWFSSLRTQLEGNKHPGFLIDKRRALTRELTALSYAPSALQLPLTPDRYPNYPQTFSEQIEDLIANWIALSVISEGWRLQPNLITDLSDWSQATRQGSNHLSAKEIQSLRCYQKILQGAIRNILDVPFPGSGKVLMLTLARYEVVSASIAAGRFLLFRNLSNPDETRFLLDGFEDGAPVALANRLSERVSVLRQDLFAQEQISDQILSQLEGTNAKLHEVIDRINYLSGKTEQTEKSESFGKIHNITSIYPGLVKFLQGTAATSLNAAEHRVNLFQQQMESAYQYQLITHNCVTELVDAVNSSFPGGDESKVLGGHIEPGSDQGFIPYRFFELVRQRYQVASVHTFPSLRNRKLAESVIGEGFWWTHLRESNTLTATSYQPRFGDSAFLLFTDQTMWTRPVFGAVNLGYAAATLAFGTLATPFDGGNHFTEGLRGVLFSLPEIAFWNIRKGSYNALTAADLSNKIDPKPGLIAVQQTSQIKPQSQLYSNLPKPSFNPGR